MNITRRSACFITASRSEGESDSSGFKEGELVDGATMASFRPMLMRLSS